MANDPFDDIPKIRLEKDDLDSFHRTRAQSSKKSSKKGSTVSEPATRTNSPSWFAFLLLLAIIVSAAGYWSSEQFKILQQAQSRIAQLEDRLSATGEDMDQSSAALQIKVSELNAKTEDLWVQMDKLWASAWRRNQTEIGVLNKTVMAIKAKSEKSTQKLSSENAENNTTIGFFKEKLENQASLLEQLYSKLDLVDNMDADLEQQLASLREKLISTALANNDLTNQIDDLRRRVIAVNSKLNEVKVIIPPVTNPQE